MAAEGGDITWFIYTGADGEIIPRDATHVFMDVTTIPRGAFDRHPNIVEVICHDTVEKIEESAFNHCPRLKRVIMPGVTVVEKWAFFNCRALTDVGCGNLEIIKFAAFNACRSLRSINLPSARIVEALAFANCKALERITVPLKDGMITADGIFTGCESLNHVDLVEGEELHETIASLHFEEWRNDMWEEITSINQILPNAPAGDNGIVFFDGEKAQVIRRWLRSVLGKMIRYKAEHQGILDEAASTLVLALPRDIVMNNVLPFLELPPHRFGVEM